MPELLSVRARSIEPTAAIKISINVVLFRAQIIVARPYHRSILVQSTVHHLAESRSPPVTPLTNYRSLTGEGPAVVGGAFPCKECPAVTYSPTPSRVQYHRRCGP